VKPGYKLTLLNCQLCSTPKTHLGEGWYLCPECDVEVFKQLEANGRELPDG
jgi:uncharacterized Zn finger protein (UPF0148 family)